jgi:hypothetical protein
MSKAMKKFGNYQYAGVRKMTERDERESRSKFWNKGKWDNFIKPFLPDNCKEMILIDMGCNAGLFLKLAEEKGFTKVIGVEANKEAFNTALEYKKRNKGKYELQHKLMEKCIDDLPTADFTILANIHYYLAINNWLDYLDKLRLKTRYCIVVTAEKKKGRIRIEKAQPDINSIRSYFSEWDEVGIIDNISLEGDPAPRNVISICFKSKIDRVDVSSLEKINRGGESVFFEEIDNSVPVDKLEYLSWLKENSRSKKGWSDRSFIKYLKSKVGLYRDVKSNLLMTPIVINSDNKVLDGNHRYEIMNHLGHNTILARKVI